MRPSDATVFVIDDDEALCEALRFLLEAAGLQVATFPSAESFLGSYDVQRRGCLLLDVRMQGMSGLELQACLARDPLHPPVILLTGHGDIPMAVQAMKAGAFDFLEKPVNDQLLVERVRAAIAADRATRDLRAARQETVRRMQLLTPREREVLGLIVTGRINRAIANELSIAERTVEVHRKRILQKMGVNSAAALTRIVLALETART
ncbi:MAG: response regulator transcription factor [Phycisphaerales bacterium]|nr:response regulator transcription factor [Phycisphaerales bacterium]